MAMAGESCRGFLSCVTLVAAANMCCAVLCRNYDTATDRFLMFLPRHEEVGKRDYEKYKIDLHIPDGLREDNLLMSGEVAASAASKYIKVMSQMQGRHLFKGFSHHRIDVWQSLCNLCSNFPACLQSAGGDCLGVASSMQP